MKRNYTIIDEALSKTSFNGNILVAVNEKVVFNKGYGYSNVDRKLKNNPDTIMRIASITKLFTAVAILKLVEESKVKLSDLVSKYINTFKHPITVHHLLSNSSGIAGFDINSDFTEISNSANVLDSIIKIFMNKELEFEPGSRFMYSISGYLILQKIIETVSGMTYYNYLHKEILEPLNMKHTFFEDEDFDKKNMAVPYSLNEGKLIPAVTFDMRIAGGGGALLSTTEDILKLNLSLLNNSILPENLSKKIFSKQIIVSDNDAYGYGMIINTNLEFGYQLHRFYHPGGGFGVRSSNTIYPEKKLQVIILSNLDDKNIFNEVKLLVDSFLLNQ